jgi:hypothetical protein
MRSHSLLSAQRKNGFAPEVVTGPLKLNISGGPTIDAPAGVSIAYDAHEDTYALIQAQAREVWQLKLHRADAVERVVVFSI